MAAKFVRSPPAGMRAGVFTHLRDRLRRQVLACDRAERLVDRDVRLAQAPWRVAIEDMPDLRQDMIVRDKSCLTGVQELGALGKNAFAVVGEEPGTGDQCVIDLELPDRAGWSLPR